jgi:cell division transport system ATP-binding protein
MIELRQVGFSYGEDAILEGVSLKLLAGSFHFLTGPSGSGKTTFLKLLYAALRPETGEIEFFGEPVLSGDRDQTAKIRRRIGVVHQDCQFLDHLTVTENIALPLIVAGRSAEKYAQNLDELLGWVGLANRAEARPPELSGGERQRAALARAVIMSPDVILADEPTGNIDWDMGQRLMTLLVELNKMGKTIVIATHDLNLIRYVKSKAPARVLRIAKNTIKLAGSDL